MIAAQGKNKGPEPPAASKLLLADASARVYLAVRGASSAHLALAAACLVSTALAMRFNRTEAHFSPACVLFFPTQEACGAIARAVAEEEERERSRAARGASGSDQQFWQRSSPAFYDTLIALLGDANERVRLAAVRRGPLPGIASLHAEVQNSPAARLKLGATLL